MKTLIAALLVTSSVWAQTPQAPARTAPPQGPPPKNLVVRGEGHITANQDPANPENFETYVVQRGDTLSGIAGNVLKNPRLWPQLWEENEHIINPHWIYPNDIILIRPVTPVSEAKPPEPEPEPAPEPVAETEPPARPVLMPPPAPPAQPAQPVLIVDEQKPVSEIKFDDLYCSGSVHTKPAPSSLKVISKFDATGGVLSSEAEYVYLSQGAEDGITAGQTYQVVRPTRTMTNPYARTKNARDLGMHYLDVGQLRVVLTQPDFSLARVLHTCGDAVDVGDILMPFEQIKIPTPPRPRQFNPLMTTNSGVTGMIVSTQSVVMNFGSSFQTTGRIPGVHGSHLGYLDRGVAAESTIVYIDIGQDHAVNPGDVFIVYRETELDRRLYDFPKEAKKLKNTRRAIGELIVVKVGERAATAIVTYASEELTLGDSVERR
jgi:hypothetical protein